MRRTLFASVSLVALAVLASTVALADSPPGIDEKFGVLPLAFEPNRGQTHKDVKFFTRGPGYQFFLTQKEAVFVFIQREMPPEDPAKPLDRIARERALREAKVTKSVVRMKFEGARKQVKLTGEDPLPGKTNYFIGNDPKQWRTDVPTYRKVRLTGAYEGIDVVFYGNGRHIEYDLVVRPGIDPGKVRVRFDGPGALEKADDGGLRIATAGGSLDLARPYLYQEIAGRKVEVAGSYLFDGGRTLAFSVPDYDRQRALVIDPQLVYSTYIGGRTGGAYGVEEPQAIAVDAAGSAFVTGRSDSLDYPTTAGSYRPAPPISGSNVPYVTKLNASGTALVYSTWIGGTNGADGVFAIAVDGGGSAWITGNTNSADYPTTPNVFNRLYGTVFVTRLDAGGNGLIFSTFLGGIQFDAGFGIALDSGGVYVAGETIDPSYPTTPGAFQTTHHGFPWGFVTKLALDGRTLVASTYLNGTVGLNPPFLNTKPGSIALDPAGRVVVAGFTDAADFPTTPGSLKPTSAVSAAFIVKLNGSLTALVAGTYVDGVGSVGSAYTLLAALDASGAVYMTHLSSVTKVSADLSQLGYQTTFFIPFAGRTKGIAVDAAGSAHVVGGTYDFTFPTTPGAFQSVCPSSYCGFLTKFSPDGSGFLYSTLLGGQHSVSLGGESWMSATGVALNASGDAYVIGTVPVDDFPTTAGAFQNVYSGGIFDSFVVKLHPTVSLPTPAISPSTGPSVGGTPVTIAGSGFQPGASVTIGGTSASVQSVAPGTIQATTGAHPPGPGDLIVTNLDSSVAFLANAFTYTCGAAPPTATVSGTASICAGSSTDLSVALTGSGPWTLNWVDGFVQSGIAASPATRTVTPSFTSTYSLTTVTDANCVAAGTGSATVTVTPIPSATITAPAAVCQNASGLVASVPAAGGGATYAWTIVNGSITSGLGTNSVVFSAGTASPVQLGVTVTLGGCSKAGSANVTVTPVATATVTGSAAICAGSSTPIQAALTGVAPWTVTWNDGLVQSGVAASPATRSVTPVASTSYSVSAVTDATGCAGTHSGLADLVVKPAPPALITPNAAIVCPGSTGNVASTVDAGAGATYAWSVANGTVTAGAGTRQITFTAGGAGNVTLSVTTTSSNGCTSTDTRIWSISPPPSAALSGPASACSGQPTNLNVNFAGAPPWTLRWSDGLVQTIPSSPATRVVVLAADATFSLTSLTDGAGCTGSVSGSVSVSVHQAASALVSGGGTVCAGAAATISAVVTSATPFSARWSDGVIQTGSGSTTLTRVVRPFGSTVYKIDAIFDGTCTSVGSGNARVTVGLEPSAALVTAPGAACAGAAGLVASVPDAGAGASYTWSLRNGTIDGGQGTRTVTFTVSDTDPAHLSVLVQAGSGCQISGSWDVTVDRRPPAPVLTAPAAAVSGDTALLASVPAAGSDVFVWTVENGTLTSGQGTNAILFTAGAPGTTTVRVVQKTGRSCASEAAVASIPVSGFSATRIVPVVVNVTGNGGAQFASELTFANPGASIAHVDLTLTPADSLGGGSATTVGQYIGPGRQLVIPDALAFFAAQGGGAARAVQSAAASGGGSVRASFTNLPPNALVYGGARTTAAAGPGRAGLAYPAPAAEDFFNVPVAVYGLRETAAERSNLALENAGTVGPIGLRVTLVSGANNARSVLPDTVLLQPGQWVQIGSVLKQAGFTNGWALVERVSGTDPFYAYGVANDNLTNDGAFLAAVRSVRPASVQVVPSIVETGAFATELVLTNPGSSPATATLNFIESLTSPLGNSTGFVTETLQPGEQRFIPDVVAYLRAHGASPGARGPGYAGPLLVRFAAGGTAADGFVASRTSAPAAGGGGYGVSYAGVPLAETATSAAWVFGLQQNTASRSNLGLLNAATNQGSIALRYDVYDGATGAKAGGAAVSLYPGQWTQVNTVLKTFGVANGYVRVTRTGGTAPWVAYGVLNDGAAPGAGTGDGSFIGMTPER